MTTEGKSKGAVLVAIAAALGNLLQGWDSSVIAGSVLYIKEEFELDSKPTMEGLLIAMSVIGATIITTVSGSISDLIGRRIMLVISSVLFFFSGLIMLWSPNIYVLLIGRLLDGFGTGLVFTLVPAYISETSPPEIRGTLNTLPQFTCSGGMFLSYCMVFGMSLMESPSWRLMLGIISIPSLFYFALTMFYLPESPRWLVSKGKVLEAKQVLQRLRGTEDVSGELASLIEGLGSAGEAIALENKLTGSPKTTSEGRDQTKSFKGSSVSLLDPVVTLFGSFQETGTSLHQQNSLVFPDSESISSLPQLLHSTKNLNWNDLENANVDYTSEEDDCDELKSPLLSHPLLSHQATKSTSIFASNNSAFGSRTGEAVSCASTNIGGGWQLVWNRKEDTLEKTYMHQCSTIAVSCRESSLVSINKESKNPSWRDLLEPGVMRALMVGIGLQGLQQISGINGVLYYTPQILEQAGIAKFVSNIGMDSTSASLFISAITSFLMLPCIATSMWLMDISGRRSLLLATIPVLVVSLLLLVLGSILNLSSVLSALVSGVGLAVYLCCFEMGFGVIPNIICAEIFPTRVRGLCMAICALTLWIGDIIVTYSFPLLLTSIGLSGIFIVYGVACMISWIFVFVKVPETKGMPLEVISQLFAVGGNVK